MQPNRDELFYQSTTSPVTQPSHLEVHNRRSPKFTTDVSRSRRPSAFGHSFYLVIKKISWFGDCNSDPRFSNFSSGLSLAIPKHSGTRLKDDLFLQLTILQFYDSSTQKRAIQSTRNDSFFRATFLSNFDTRFAISIGGNKLEKFYTPIRNSPTETRRRFLPPLSIADIFFIDQRFSNYPTRSSRITKQMQNDISFIELRFCPTRHQERRNQRKTTFPSSSNDSPIIPLDIKRDAIDAKLRFLHRATILRKPNSASRKTQSTRTTFPSSSNNSPIAQLGIKKDATDAKLRFLHRATILR